MTFKKILPFILIFIAVLGVFFGFFFSIKVNYAQAACQEGFTEIPGLGCVSNLQIKSMGGSPAGKIIENPEGNCSIWNWSTENCVLSVGAFIAEYAIWTPISGLFLPIAGFAMDTSISLTINGSIFRDLANEQNGVVTVGWGISRDIVNIFLIFILLYIAIATILQVSGYGAKELLTMLIVIAFLVNFSLVITKMVIDASNVLSVGFYNAFPQENGQIKASLTFRNAFNLDKMITENSFDKYKDLKNIYLVKILTYLLGAGVAAIAGFIFFVFAILFVIRMVVLLILLILAPLAFGAMILPGTKDHAKKWWHALFSQAFFAPAALFMLYLSVKMATSSFINDALGVPGTGTGISDMLVDAQNKTNWDNIAKFVLQFVIIAIILIASIIVAKQLGAMGAQSAISGVSKGLRKAQGYAGRIGKYGGTRLGGMAAEKVLQGEGRAARFAQRIPLVTRGLAGVSAMEQKRVKEKEKGYEKAYGTYSEAGLEAMLKTPIIMPTKRRAIEHVLAKRGEEAAQKKAKEEAKKKGKPTDVISMLTEALKAELKTELKEEMKAEKPASPPPSATPKTP